MTMTYDQAFEKLDTCLESALLDLDVEVLTEGVGDAAKKVGGGIAKAGKAVVAFIKKLIKIVADFFRNLIMKIKAKKAVPVKYYSGTPKGVIDSGLLQKYCTSYIVYAQNVFAGRDAGEPLPAGMYDEFQKGMEKEGTVPMTVIMKNAATIASALQKLDSIVKNIPEDKQAELAEQLRNIKSFVETLNRYGKVIANLVKDENAPKAQNEGVTMTRTERMAHLLLEAAQLLAEEAEDTGAPVDAAVVADNITAGDVVQDPVSDIPAETPAVAADPAPEASGGEGEKIDLEEIKDLVGDDQEAIALMTDGEGGAVCESVTIDFGI